MDFGILPNTVALAAVALLGYLFGRSGLRNPSPEPNRMRKELERSRHVVTELERIALDVRRKLAAHQGSIRKFNSRLCDLQSAATDQQARDFCRQAERLLAPTKQLAKTMASAYDALRRQSEKLMAYSEVRTDALTGLSNRAALNDSLTTLLAMQKRYRSTFVAAVFDVDPSTQMNDFYGREQRDDVLRRVAGILEASIRETDIVARFTGTEFVVAMPETDLEGAAVVARRIRRAVEQETDVTISSGFAQAIDGDTCSTLLARADMALNAAKTAGRNCIFQHGGCVVEAIASTRLLTIESGTAAAEVLSPSGRKSNTSQFIG